VGREAELARLASALDRALEGSGSIVLITGEAGIGKTALAGEFLRRAREREPSMVLCRGRCAEQYGAGEAFLPFLDALGTLLLGRGREPTAALLRAYAPTWCLQLPALATTESAGEDLRRQTLEATRERMLREMGDLFEATSSRGLLVGFLEDMQWIDPSSADVVRHLVNRIARQRILLLGTLRPGARAADGPVGGFVTDLRSHRLCHEISVGPFDAPDVSRLLDARFPPHRFPPDLPQRLHRRTEGHPFYVTTLVQLLVERGDIGKLGEEWTLSRVVTEADFDAPESIRALVRRKLGSLDEEDRRALQHASVMGREFLSTALAAVLEVDEMALEERLVRLDRDHHLIDTRGEEELPQGELATRYRFRHSFHQEVLYDDLVSKRRVLMHRLVGERLATLFGNEAPRIAASLALHFERGRDFAAAATYLAHAAENADRLGAHREAEEYLRRALELAERLPDDQRGEKVLELLRRLGTVRLALSRFSEAAETFTRMLGDARAVGSSASECAALSGLCNALFFSHRIEEMAVRAAQALHAAERAGSGALRAEAMLVVAQILQHEGDLDDCRRILDEVALLARGAGHQRALLAAVAYRGVVHYWQTEYAQAEERLTEALALAREARDGLMVLICLQFVGLARGNRGRISQALEALREGMELGRRNEDRFWLPRLASHIGWVHRELQDFERAIEHDRNAVSMARDLGVPEAEASALLNLCLDHTHAGQLEPAAEILDGLERREREAAWFGWLDGIRLQGALAEHWLARGDAGRASQHATQLLDLALPREAHTYVAAAHRILFESASAAGDVATARQHESAALESARSHPAPLHSWRLHAAIGRVRDAEGDRARARDAYRESAALVRSIAAGVQEPDLKNAFLESGAVRAVLDGETQS
jgi:tetratricopeptide (TPR) repeat protein